MGENAKCCPPQALSIKGDVTLGIPHSRLLGRKWRCVGVERPSAGKSVKNPALESTLPTNENFTQKEWAAFGIAHLHFDDYTVSKINDVVHYFQPAASKFDRWAYKSEASEEYKTDDSQDISNGHEVVVRKEDQRAMDATFGN